MRRRIRGAIVGVAAIIILALGIPLAIVVQRWVLDGEVVELQASAATALTEIDVPVSTAQLDAVATEPDAPTRFGVYGLDGVKRWGDGPATADAPVTEALQGQTASKIDGEIVVATPIVERDSERVQGVLRVSESMHDANRRSRTAWAVMAAAGTAALGLAWVIGNRLSRVLADPLSALAARASTIGDGAADPDPPSGIVEIDDLATALAERSGRIHESLQRERRFSADVSHQLRTPITALRLKLERTGDVTEGDTGLDDDDRAGMLAEVERVEATIEHLLAIARDAMPVAGPLALDEVIRDAARRWATRAASTGRALTAGDLDPATVRANRASIDQVLDVLINNAVGHGEGTITVSTRHLAGAVAVDVADEGDSIVLLDAERIFERGHGTGDGEGIGLAVARSIAEAEGGRLVLSRHRPTTFSLVLLAGDAAPDASAPR
jgi:signal transduction histidine kinase